jgi:hypothetical protein
MAVERSGAVLIAASDPVQENSMLALSAADQSLADVRPKW